MLVIIQSMIGNCARQFALRLTSEFRGDSTDPSLSYRNQQSRYGLQLLWHCSPSVVGRCKRLYDHQLFLEALHRKKKKRKNKAKKENKKQKGGGEVGKKKIKEKEKK
jgi:hypothetical protein